MSETQGAESLTKDDLQELLNGKFGQDVRIMDFTSLPATAAGDNYGSTLLSLNVSILNNNEPEILHIIAKLVPPTEYLQQVFDIENTFCKEINMYKLVYPELLEMQSEYGLKGLEIINLVPSFFGARFPSARANADAILLLENLKFQGFMVADRLSGLNLEHCECVMQKLASFHALCIALRIHKPETFKKTVEAAAIPFHIGEKDENEVQVRKDFVASIRKNVPESQQYLDQIEKSLLSFLKFENSSSAKEPFATLVHNDLWTNNIMFQYAEQFDHTILTDLKLIDFQLTLYCSPVRDIIFFLYTSAQEQVIKNNFDDLIDVYHNFFINVLKKLKCDVQNFSKSAFLQEVDTFAPTQLYHILFMLSVIYAEKQNAEELDKFTSKDHLLEVGSTELNRRKVIEIIRHFHERGWIKETCEL